jgi:hypothetical protein
LYTSIAILWPEEGERTGKILSTIPRFHRHRNGRGYQALALFKRAPRIRQGHGLNLSTAAPTSTNSELLIWMRPGFSPFFMLARGPQVHPDRAEALAPPGLQFAGANLMFYLGLDFGATA